MTKDYVIFINDDEGYLKWVAANPNGFIVNIDEPNSTKDYPKVHRASHKSMSTSARSNYTTGQYFKVCSNNIESLKDWSQREYRKTLTECKIKGCKI